jgi:putative glutathione S-transferase
MPDAAFPDETSASGEFERQASAFRNCIDPAGDHPPAAGRYHLYVSLACPWAHRTIIARQVKGLEDAISMSVVDPIRDERGWAFREGRGHGPDPVNGFAFLMEAYRATDPSFEGRVTVPVLWDRERECIVNNESSELLRMLNASFGELATRAHDLYPNELRGEVDAVNADVYEHINNGVYRAGFATSQGAYEKAVRALFDALDRVESRLADREFLVGEQLTEADIRLFTTLVRFDAVYVGHFKCNLRRIADFPHLSRYLAELYARPDFGPTVDFDHIKRHYYMTHEAINPTGIVPLGPELAFERY